MSSRYLRGEILIFKERKVGVKGDPNGKEDMVPKALVCESERLMLDVGLGTKIENEMKFGARH